MSTEPVGSNDFVSSWLVKAKADAKLNQDMVGLLADHHSQGTGTDDNIVRSLLKLTAEPEVSE
jgi:hypothetical protein